MDAQHDNKLFTPVPSKKIILNLDNNIYSDFDLTFLTHPVTHDIVKKIDTKSIIQSLKNLLLTSKEEILMEPEIDGGIGNLLFETKDPLLNHRIKTRIEEVIKTYEPRIELKEINIKNTNNPHEIHIQLVYYFANNQTPIVDTIKLIRTR